MVVAQGGGVAPVVLDVVVAFLVDVVPGVVSVASVYACFLVAGVLDGDPFGVQGAVGAVVAAGGVGLDRADDDGGAVGAGCGRR